MSDGNWPDIQTGSQQYTTSVAHGFIDADDDFKLVHDLAIKQAHKAAYTSFGVWGIVIFLLSRIGGAYAVIVGVLWILAVSAILQWWYIDCLKRQQGTGVCARPRHRRRSEPLAGVRGRLDPGISYFRASPCPCEVHPVSEVYLNL